MHSIALTDGPTWARPGHDMVRALIDDALKSLDSDRHAARTYLGQAHRIIDRELDVAPATPDNTPPRPKGARLTGWRLRRLAEFIEQNIERTIKVGELARVIRISTSQLGRCFNVTFGLTPSDYIMRQRLERARHMMVSSDEGLAQIAYACGLCDQAHLTRAFRKHYGCPPAAWRRSHRGGRETAQTLWTKTEAVA
ncbi:helix-turn-helix domain-containing protein [Caulobacter sp. CCH9-E1]|jgi:AraC family transcriptional regulator|uniref:helix-turn-helix domain-containing protein n=1 Tax=Caulobacter sp. CCH9-E1 TaxID=1768768 RepID=UPI0009EBDD1D|nr:AraC family transcriptional regulator [Caulobacter sp. CCH9-E1]